jgi:cold shock CspA family protein
MLGTIGHWNSTAGYGFVHADDGRQFFAHVSMVIDRVTLARGERVAFEIGVDARTGRPCATSVRVLGPADARAAAADEGGC